MKVRVLDFGMGNLRSVARAFSRAGVEVEVSAQVEGKYDRLVLPGVGAFAEAVRRLGPEWPALKAHVAAGRPLLGICLGMQLLFARSHEHGLTDGLACFDGEVVPIPTTVTVPNMGWHQLTGLGDPYVYFAHSFAVPATAGDAAATITHGGRWIAAVKRGPIWGYQFHPEKSGPAGLQLIKDWLGMLIYPAIDLMGGDAVRLERGEKNSRKVVGVPLELVEKFAPAPLIHVVDLDGAFAGRVQQTALIAQLAAKHAIQVGGGVRSEADIDQLFSVGVERVVLGTAAIRDPALLDVALKKWSSDRIVVALDVKDGRVALSGWVEASELAPAQAAKTLAARGVRWILTTAVHRDGMLEGPDFGLLEEIRASDSRIQLIASGGVGSLDDLKQLHARKMPAAIVGKALYAGRFTLDEAIAC